MASLSKSGLDDLKTAIIETGEQKEAGMDYRGVIVELLDLVEQEEAYLGANLPDGERERCGEQKDWAPKEVICHLANWTGRQVENILRVRAGGKFIAYNNYLELNDEEYLDDCKLSWDESVQRSREKRQQLRELVSGMNDEELLEDLRDQPDDQRPNWQWIIFTSVDHPMIHMAEILHKNGLKLAAGDFQERLAKAELKLAEADDVYQGRVLYNLACGQALGGQRAAAIENLRRSFPLYPGLVEWSKQDTDLDSLRELPEYQALYS
jgi:hypothetical protein